MDLLWKGKWSRTCRRLFLCMTVPLLTRPKGPKVGARRTWPTFGTKLNGRIGELTWFNTRLKTCGISSARAGQNRPSKNYFRPKNTAQSASSPSFAFPDKISPVFCLFYKWTFGCFGRLHRRRLWQTGGFFPPTWIKWGGSPHTLFSAEELFASSELNQTSLRKEYSVLENYYLRINSNKISKVQGVTKVLSPQHIFNITIRFIY